MQLMPLQHLDVHFLEVEALRQHSGDFAAALDGSGLSEKFHDTSILAVFDGIVRLGDKVGVIFSAHGYGA